MTDDTILTHLIRRREGERGLIHCWIWSIGHAHVTLSGPSHKSLSSTVLVRFWNYQLWH